MHTCLLVNDSARLSCMWGRSVILAQTQRFYPRVHVSLPEALERFQSFRRYFRLDADNVDLMLIMVFCVFSSRLSCYETGNGPNHSLLAHDPLGVVHFVV
jgi:hypothetical protein